MIKFCQAHKASPKFIDQVIIKVMQHSSFDATCNTEEKAALMGTVFKMLHNLIDSQQIERTTNILMDLKTYIIELGEQQF
jgi:phosphopantetheine adenylyltransferase